MASRIEPHVLVVEDEPAQREVLAYNLEAEGFRITRAEDGEQALRMVDEDQPDVIVLDWMLPHVSGIEICRQIRARIVGPDTRRRSDVRIGFPAISARRS